KGDMAIIGPRPVSYTHLDVYKLSVLDQLFGTSMILLKNVINTRLMIFVLDSYTHLDVYKRQLPYYL
ncbi:hypothetical protein A5844_000545, partial [Enterococcus sp. 10A9_DIV0425]